MHICNIRFLSSVNIFIQGFIDDMKGFTSILESNNMNYVTCYLVLCVENKQNYQILMFPIKKRDFFNR